MLAQDDKPGDDKNPSRHNRQNKSHDADQNQSDAGCNSQNFLQTATPICAVDGCRKLLFIFVCNTNTLN